MKTRGLFHADHIDYEAARGWMDTGDACLFFPDVLTLTERILDGSIQGRLYGALGRTDPLSYTLIRAQSHTYPLGSAPRSI